MLTLFSVPKPFRGDLGDIQRNAIVSWQALDRELQIVLVGDDEGVEEAARAAGVAHVGELERSPRGTPRLDSAFARVDDVAVHDLRCFVNADIVLLDDFLPAVRRVRNRFDRFLVVGESRDLSLQAAVPLANEAFRLELRRRARVDGRLRGYAALDYFVFPRDHFGELPPFLIGRACFDNWLVWKARQVGPVVDATRAVVSVHQSHDYGHIPGGLEEAYYGEEAKRNEELAGGRSHIYTLYDASHRLPARGPIYPYLGSVLRAREGMRAGRVRFRIELEMRTARRNARRNRPSRAHEVPAARVVGVFREPTAEQNVVLDSLSRRAGIELSVLYTGAGTTTARPAHTHWVMRSTSIRGHRVNYAIPRALWRLRPEVVLLGGDTGFAGHVAKAWCRLLRVPCFAVEGASLDGDAVERAAGRAA